MSNTEAAVCPQCLDFFKEPLILSCGHSLCLSCADQQFAFGLLKAAESGIPICKKNSNSATSVTTEPKNEIPILCGTCSSKTSVSLEKGIKALSVNYTLRDLCQETIKGMTKCEECNVEAAISFCEKCEAKYCDLCFDKVHAASAVLKRHLKAPVTTKKLKCPKHNQELDMFCSHCDKVICLKCTYSAEHKAHPDSIGTLEDHAQSVAAQLSEKTARLDQTQQTSSEELKTRRELFETIHQKTVTRINESLDAIIKLAQEKKQELLSKEMEFNENLKAQHDAFQTVLNSGKVLVERVKKADEVESTKYQKLVSKLENDIGLAKAALVEHVEIREEIDQVVHILDALRGLNICSQSHLEIDESCVPSLPSLPSIPSVVIQGPDYCGNCGYYLKMSFCNWIR